MERADFKIEVWSLVGPTLTLATLGILFALHSPLSLPLSLLALVGIFLCWKWQINGIFFASSLLVTFFIYEFFAGHANNLIWHTGIGFSLVTSFFITGLSYHEITGVIDFLQQEIDSVKQQAQYSQQPLIDKVTALEQQLQQAGDELTHIRERHQAQLEESSQAWVEKVTGLESLLKEASQEVARISDAANAFARDSITARESAKAAREEFETIQETQKIVREEALQKQADEYRHYQINLQKMEEQIQHLTSEKNQLTAATQLLQQQLDAEKQKVPTAQALPEESHGWLRRTEGMYNQLREQFEEKSATLEETRRQLFFTQEKLLLVQREYEESWYENTTLESIEKYVLKLDQEFNILEQENDKLKSLVDVLIRPSGAF